MLKNNAQIHFIGVCGIGMSAIALYMKSLGLNVTGSDKSKNNTVMESLKSYGIKVFNEHKPSNVEYADVVVFSSAITQDNVELYRARELGIQIVHRSEALEKILAGKKVIAVTGTHGKTTTSSLIGMICIESGIEPLVIVGGIVKNLNSNFYNGNGGIAVVEADESDGSFNRIPHDFALVTNMGLDHVDYYDTASKLISEYEMFISQSKEVLLFGDDIRLWRICNQAAGNSVFSYSINNMAANAIAYNIENVCDTGDANIGGTRFDVIIQGELRERLGMGSISGVKLPIPGIHNVQNALGAIISSLLNGCSIDSALKALANFRGVERRFSKIGEIGGAIIIDDYAHHPTEIKAVLDVALGLKKANGGNLTVVFEPHRYTRLSHFFSEFVEILSSAHIDTLILMDVYGASEINIYNIDSNSLKDRIEFLSGKTVHRVSNFASLRSKVLEYAAPGDAILAIGAGNVSSFMRSIVDECGGSI